MKKTIVYCLVFFMMITGVLGTSVVSFGEETEDSGAAVSDQIASEDERAPSQEVGEAGMIPVSGEDVKDGTYSIDVDSSSSMFKIVKAELTVKDGKMSAVMTLSGTGYLKLFMGTGEEAVAADESEYANYVEDEDGAYTYEVSVEALNKALECTGFSKRKEKWYDHQIVFRADTLPEGVVLTDLSVNQLEYEDGEYTVEVEMSGGTGRASIASPTQLTIKDGEATARIQWSSSNYDYMLVNDKKYFPLGGEDVSVFEIPVYVFDEPMTVIADTTAMSVPHEIEYTLTFHSDTIESVSSGSVATIIVVAVIVIIILAAIFIFIRKKKKKNEKAI